VCHKTNNTSQWWAAKSVSWKQKLHQRVNAHPELVLTVAGDFTAGKMKSVLPNVTCETRGDKTLNRLYSTHKEAYKALPCPPYGSRPMKRMLSYRTVSLAKTGICSGSHSMALRSLPDQSPASFPNEKPWITGTELKDKAFNERDTNLDTCNISCYTLWRTIKHAKHQYRTKIELLHDAFIFFSVQMPSLLTLRLLTLNHAWEQHLMIPLPVANVSKTFKQVLLGIRPQNATKCCVYGPVLHWGRAVTLFLVICTVHTVNSNLSVCKLTTSTVSTSITSYPCTSTQHSYPRI
jgi:hypothetical protein